MSTIRILPEILSNKIAAGEVVERPAAVVKELIENALDAGSTRILIDIEKGGRALIRVADNGSGMSRDDAMLSIERYATSKLKTDADLFSIRTLGFRGEALPSIAAVSRFNLISRTAEAEAGVEIEIEGGRLKQVSDIGAPPGTMVTVKQLFYNTPARRKFLKTDVTEMGHITATVATIALVQPAVHFKLSHNSKTVKNWPITEDPANRIADVLGSDLKPGLHAIGLDEPDISVFGWIALPAYARKTSRGIHIYVNGRHVRDRMVQHAIFTGYAQRLVKGQFPVAAVFIEVPFDQVDVNVHPAKHEVRFARRQVVHNSVRRAVAQTLYEFDRPRWSPSTYGDPAEGADSTGYRVSERKSMESGAGRWQTFGMPADSTGHLPRGKQRAFPAEQSTSPRQAPPMQNGEEPASPATVEPHAKGGFGEMRVVGQVANTYIVCDGPAGLVLIDQHAAHERILFEQLSRKAAAADAVSQNLLVPETVELDPGEAAALTPILPKFDELGLQIEPFGGNTFVVRALPAALAERDARTMVKDLAEQAVELGNQAHLADFVDACRMVSACHGAIRARQRLDDRQMQTLLRQLDACENPSHCPHGRPTWVRWEINDLEKMFKRIV